MSTENNSHRVFHPDLESVEEFIQRFKMQNGSKLNATNATDADKAQLLANALPIPVMTDIQRRLQPTQLTAASYEDIEKTLISSYGIKKSIIGACVNFMSRKQKPNESIETYAKALNQLASQCAYKDCCRDRMIRDAFVSGLKSVKMISTLISECDDKKFNEIVDRAKIIEQIKLDVEDIAPNSVSEAKPATYKISSPAAVKNKNTSQPRNNNNSRVSNKYRCYRCGTAGKHHASQCYALNKTCTKCNKSGHLASVCKTNPKKGNNSGPSNQFNYINPEEFDPTSQFMTIKYMRGRGKSLSPTPMSPASSVASLDLEFPPLSTMELTGTEAAEASTNRKAWDGSRGLAHSQNRFAPLHSFETLADMPNSLEICESINDINVSKNESPSRKINHITKGKSSKGMKQKDHFLEIGGAQKALT